MLWNKLQTSGFLKKNIVQNLCIHHIKYKQKLTMQSHDNVQNNEEAK